MKYAIQFLEKALAYHEQELEDNIRLYKSCEESIKPLFREGKKENRRNIRSLKKAINVLKINKK